MEILGDPRQVANHLLDDEKAVIRALVPYRLWETGIAAGDPNWLGNLPIHLRVNERGSRWSMLRSLKRAEIIEVIGTGPFMRLKLTVRGQQVAAHIGIV